MCGGGGGGEGVLRAFVPIYGAPFSRRFINVVAYL